MQRISRGNFIVMFHLSRVSLNSVRKSSISSMTIKCQFLVFTLVNTRNCVIYYRQCQKAKRFAI